MTPVGDPASSEDLVRKIEDLDREVRELRQSLSEERAVRDALAAGQVDAVLDRAGGGALLLKAAQAELQASEERYRTIVTTAEEGVWTTDADMVTTFVNEGMASSLGYRVHEMIGRSVGDFMDEAAADAARQAFERRRQGVRERHDVAFRRRDGTVLWASVAASPLLHPDGRFAGSLAMVTDVTQRRQAEEERRQSEERFRTIFRSSPAAIGIGSGGRILDANDRYCEFFGYSREELIGRTVQDLRFWLDPTDRERVLEGVRTDGEVHDVAASFRRKDGTIRAGIVTVEKVEFEHDGGGTPDAEPTILFMVVDVTERNRADELLRESEERYRVLFDGSPMPMWAYDPESLRIVMANQAAAEQYGYSTDEFAAMSLPDLRPPEEVEKLRAAIRAEVPGRSDSGTWKHRRKDGTLLDVNVHTSGVIIGGRSLRLAVLHDVTQRRVLEEQFRQSQKMEAVGRLAGGVAHDFNNLLTAILGYSDLLAERFKVGDPERAEIQEIRRAGERAAALTRQLLAFSRKQVLALEALDLGGILRGMSRLLERLIGEDITVSVVVAPDLGVVLADPGQMEQVVLNLAVNARDAMPRGGELLLELKDVELDEAYASEHLGATAGPYVMLSVTDTGTGMTPDVQKQVFEPFFTTKAAGEGTGLGLSTVYGIVNQSGGTIWVTSEPDRGTTFNIYLPRIAGAVATPPPPSGSFAAVEGTGTILLVEDEEQLRRLARRILELGGYTVLDAPSPAEALDLAHEHNGPIHLLLTDVVMPGMSGPEVASALLKERPGTPVLYMSGYTDDAIVQHGILKPGTQFLQKPFTPHRLAQRVHEILRARS